MNDLKLIKKHDGEKAERPVLKKVVLSGNIKHLAYYDNVPKEIRELAE